ncbi:PEP-CTERM sorting domain-containing protein [Okeania sp. KiyG1]|uniref:PEP-CTERM sorting domain-containing protein n=1 Tax=Okeania sp. KiyG1 TaxID=2720165 RepID=UPI0019225CDA|nr:PEP-CTERM sorting domain-containing protein [Okeania sp. KiyG1]GGA26936.1 hypothetical protein CYANOKiyG1_43090 [Okeania sp. KiyG1]
MKNSGLKTLTSASILSIAVAGISLPAWSFQLNIQPPEELELDGMDILQGQFNLTGATGYSFDNPDGMQFINSEQPVVHDAIIGDTSVHVLFDDVPDDIEVLKLSGFFNATNPDKPNAHFNIIVAGIEPGGPGEFTYYLPTMTNMASNYIIDVGPTKALGDNTNYFVDGGGLDWMPEVITNEPNQSGEGVTVGEWFIGLSSNESIVGSTMGADPFIFNGLVWDQPHGTQRNIPEPSSTIGLLALTTLGLGSALKRKIKK